MKTILFAVAMLLLVGAAPAGAQLVVLGAPGYYGGWYQAPPYPYPAYGAPLAYPYPYPLPPAPSFGFGRGGIYGHAFVGRGDGVTAYTLPGYRDWYR
jgi:hypothetical protein